MALSPGSEALPFSTVLLATDLTPASDEAAEHAIELATQLRARLLVVHVMDSGHGLLRPLGRSRPVEDREDRTEAANRLVARAQRAGARAACLVWDGDPSDGILAAADAEGADIIVVGSRGRGTMGRLLGSVSDAVVHRARVPVLVVRPSMDERED